MALPIWWQLPFQNVGGISINLVAFALISAINWWQLSWDIYLSANKRRTHVSQSKPLHFRLCLASPGGFEPLTPRLGGECSIQLSYEDMSDFWLKIRLSGTFQASGSVAGYSITYAFWMNCSIQLSSIHSPLVASYITLTLTDSNYRVLFPIVQRRQASPFLRRRLFYPLN